MENNTWHGCDQEETRRIPGSNARPSKYLSVFRSFSEFRPLVNVASACYSPLHFGFRRVLFTSAFSSILKMLALIVATEIQLFLNEKRSGCKHRDAPPGDYFNGILNTELPALRSMSQAFGDVTHQSKWRDLRTLMEKVFNFFY